MIQALKYSCFCACNWLQICGVPPSNLTAVLQEEREKRQAVEREESILYGDVLKQRHHIELVLNASHWATFFIMFLMP